MFWFRQVDALSEFAALNADGATSGALCPQLSVHKGSGYAPFGVMAQVNVRDEIDDGEGEAEHEGMQQRQSLSMITMPLLKSKLCVLVAGCSFSPSVLHQSV